MAEEKIEAKTEAGAATEPQAEATPAPEPFVGDIVTPDLQFVNEIIAGGGESLKKCYQCATCSVVCNLTPVDKPFPRKEMTYAQWGLRDKLFGNPDIWLCHQCSDCTAYRPGGAKPGEVLNAVRKLSIECTILPSSSRKSRNMLSSKGRSAANSRGSSLLADQLAPEERAKTQGVNDLLVGLASAVGRLGSGFVFASVGYDAMGVVGAAVTLVPILLTLRWQVGGRSQPSPAYNPYSPINCMTSSRRRGRLSKST